MALGSHSPSSVRSFETGLRRGRVLAGRHYVARDEAQLSETSSPLAGLVCPGVGINRMRGIRERDTPAARAGAGADPTGGKRKGPRRAASTFESRRSF